MTAPRRLPVRRTLPVRFLRAGATTAELRGIDLQPWLAALDIEPGLLFDERSRITLDQASRLIRELWRLTDDELFGLGSAPVPRGTFRMLCLAVLSSPDVRTVLDRWSDFSRVIPGLPRFEVTEGPARTEVCVAVNDERDPAYFVTELLLVVTLRFLGWLTGRRLALERVRLPYPMPEYAEDYEVVFGTRVDFDEPVASFVLENQALTMPVMRTEAETEDWLRASPVDLLAFREHGTTTGDQVRRILGRGLHGDWPTPEDVATQLSMSTQHLRRILRAEGTSVSRIKEELLRDASIASLVRGEESIVAISDRLGFSEPSAFYRAFRRWTGSAPGAYRPKTTESGL